MVRGCTTKRKYIVKCFLADIEIDTRVFTILTSLNQASLYTFGFARTIHSKYTSSPSLMSSGFSVSPILKLTTGWYCTSSRHLSSNALSGIAGFSARHVKYLPSSSIVGMKLRMLKL
ncbi:hypothetical protein ALC56_08681 [Trachymyrmex septentrionalis]|uniref:Uncharacterized protein n=1 Tax=Trachymyrmex septentrionalis TaxID=34720 RepID=A0A195F8E2_9HYME|nr:hypothetical protein ALC56_08681 [Trachymyrmex septentrionalis]